MDVEEKKKPQPPKKPLLFWYAIILVALMVINLFITPAIAEKVLNRYPMINFWKIWMMEKIKEVNLESDTIYYSLESEDKNGKEQICKTGRIADGQEVERLQEAGVKFSSEIPNRANPLVSF